MKEIKVLGPGCAKCKKLAENVQEALKETNEEAVFKYVTDINTIIAAGIMMTPGLVIDDKVISTGKVLNVKELKELFTS